MNGHAPTSTSNGALSISHADPILPSLSSTWLSKVVFLGTGTSGQVPAVHCVTSPSFGGCPTCSDAMKPRSRNRRGCTSVAVVGRHQHESEDSTILIDCGKTFYSNALVHFPKNGVRKLKAVLLTHAHADAVLGLDDLRAWTMGGVVQPHVDIYLTEQCMETVEGMFPYLVDRSKSTGGGDVGTLRWHIIDQDRPFTIGTGRGQVQIQPLPVLHGFINRTEPFWTLGFRIDGFSYVSDCHSVPASTAQLMSGSEAIVIDALKMDRHSSHFSFSQALSFLSSLPSSSSSTKLPKLGILTDFTHRIEHHATQDLLDTWRRDLMRWQVANPNARERKLEEVGKGEAGGVRWWDGVWDEEECERRMTVEVKGEAKRGQGEEEEEGEEREWKKARNWIPKLVMSWDGMVVEFQRA